LGKSEYLIILLLLIVAGYFVFNSGKSTDTDKMQETTTNTDSDVVKITIEDFKHSPSKLVVKRGTVIEVTNLDSAGHTVTALDGSFDTGIIVQNQTKTLVMDELGLFNYRCTPHPSMTGVIEVI